MYDTCKDEGIWESGFCYMGTCCFGSMLVSLEGLKCCVTGVKNWIIVISVTCVKGNLT
jgi:hypothetical protein